MTDRDVARWRNSREWLNDGECCGDKDSEGICAAPACVFGEAVKELQLAADRIEKLEAALRVYAEEDHWFGDKFEPITFPEGECKCCYEHFSDQGEIARKALEGKENE